MRILIGAYACEPGKGSEPGVGWNWARELARRGHEVWVLTRANNRAAIEKAVAAEGLADLHPVYFDFPRWARFWKRGQRGVHAYYYLWQLAAARLVRRICREHHFDVAHHVTFVNYWQPSAFAFGDVPFIWGPVGGGEEAPAAFWRDFSLRGRMYEAARELIRRRGELDPLVKIAARRAAMAFATTGETATRLRSLGAREARVISQVGLLEEERENLARLPEAPSLPFRFVSLGRLLHWKGYHLAVRAFARVAMVRPEAEYWVVGDGPERQRLETLAGEFGIGGRVRFWGSLPRPQALKLLGQSHALVHPSLHDSGGWVCVEAMAAGRPVVCLDLGGPAVQVTEETGFKVPAREPEEAVAGLADAMLRLAGDRALLRRMGEAGRRRVATDFAWERRVAEMEEVYRAAAQDRAEEPGNAEGRCLKYEVRTPPYS